MTDLDLTRPSDAGQRGHLHLADRAVQRIASHAAEGVEGVTRGGSGLDKVVGRTRPRVGSTIAGDRVRLEVDLAVVWPHPAGDVARSVRTEVARQVASLTGLTVSSVDVTVARFEPASDHTRKRRVE